MTSEGGVTSPVRLAPRTVWSDWYLPFLSAVLLGYAVMGKGFAYVGIPPLYIGELALLSGMAIVLRSGGLIASLATLPSLLLAITMILVVVRTVPYVSLYGVEALRDSVIVLYASFAFIVIALLLEKPARVGVIIRHYRVMLTCFPAMTVGYCLTKYWFDEMPRVVNPEVPLVNVQAAAVGTHLAGAAVFVILGLGKVSKIWTAVWVITFVLVGATSRGATLATLVPVLFTLVVLGRVRFIVTTIAATLGVFSVVLALETSFFPQEEAKWSTERPVSAQQIFENARSVFGESGHQTEGTKQWRLDWWHVIISDTVNGPNFWTGRGFGLNIADADGFGGHLNEGGVPLRSPHSAHMTILARAGVPGLVLWGLTLTCWTVLLLKTMFVARLRGDREWSNLFLWPLSYVVASLINASFDVTIEGPMQGIWFWCALGFGTACVMIYRAGVSDDVLKVHP